jgi:cbb3-type cytochrome oxidase subunit 3
MSPSTTSTQQIVPSGFSPGLLSGGGQAPAPIHDIAGPLPFFPYSIWQVTAFLGILLLIFLVGIWFWRQRTQKKLTPQEQALRDLALLQAKLMEGGDHEFGIQVSSLLRRYLEASFGVAASRQTTEEFLLSLQTHPSFSTEEQDSLSLFLHQSDLLKFAGGAAGEKERIKLLEAASQFIHKGREKEEPNNITPKKET